MIKTKFMFAMQTAALLSVMFMQTKMTVRAEGMSDYEELYAETGQIEITDDLFAPETEADFEEEFYKNSHITMVSAAERLNIRSGPGTDTEILGVIDEDTVVKVLGQYDAEWLYIDFDGIQGYVSAEYTIIQSQIEAEPEQITETPVEMVQEADTVEIEIIKEADIMNMENRDTVLLLAALIQCEAGSEPYEGQVAVGAVVMNRVKSSTFPDTVSDVIYQPGQFTPVGTGKVDRVYNSGKIYESCIRAAEESLSGVSNVGECLYFHRYDGCSGLIIGHHVFK